MREAIAICQSMPGPLAIQVGIYIGYLRVEPLTIMLRDITTNRSKRNE